MGSSRSSDDGGAELGLCCQALFAVPAVPGFAPWGWEQSQGGCIPGDKLIFREDCWVFHFGIAGYKYTVCKKREFLARDQSKVGVWGGFSVPRAQCCSLKAHQRLQVHLGQVGAHPRAADPSLQQLFLLGCAAAPAQTRALPWVLLGCKIPGSWSEEMVQPCAMKNGV